MGWVVPAIIAAKGVIDYFGNKRKESDAVRRARIQHDEYYNSPYHTAVNQYLRDYWNTHGLQERFGNQPDLLENLLRAPRFDANDPKYKNPGAGAKLGGAFADAIAAHYAPKTSTTVASTFLRGGAGGGGNTAATSLYGSRPGTMDSPGTSGLFGGDGAAAYPPGTAIGEGLPGGQEPAPTSTVGSSRFQGPVAGDADPYDAESILAGILRGDGTPGGLFGGTPGQFDGSGAAYAVPLRRALRGKVQGL